MYETIIAIIGLLAVCTIQSENGLSRGRRAFDPVYGSMWHFKFANFTEPQLKAAYYNGKLRIYYRDATDAFSVYFYSSMESSNYYEFTNRQPVKFVKGSHLDALIYDDNSIGSNSGLSLRQVYPALIIVSNKNAYSTVDDNKSWLNTCRTCVQSTISIVKSEIFKSNDGTFWASFNDNNRVITTSNMKNWIYHANLNIDVTINNLFPIIDGTGASKWVLVQSVSDNVKYYNYYVGDATHQNGYVNERGPYKLTSGPDDLELTFATKGDSVTTSQIAIPTLINTYFGFQEDITSSSLILFKAPIILGTPRSVMFKDFNGIQKLVQMPLVQPTDIPQKYKYHFENVVINGSIVNPLNSIRSASFILDMVFDLQMATEVGVHIRKSADKLQRTQIGYLIEYAFYVDRYSSGYPPGMPITNFKKYQSRFDAREDTVDKTNIVFKIYADGPVLEVFCDQGQVNFNLLIFSKSSSNRMEIISSRGSALLKILDIVTYDD